MSRCRPCSKNTIENITFDEVSVLAAIHNVKPNLSAGPDRLPPLLFKQLRYSLAHPLALLYNQLFSVSTVPPAWKQATIIPVFKKGAAGAVCKFHLHASQVRLWNESLRNKFTAYVHLLENNLLSSAQHGFVKGRSTCTNLFDAVNNWTLTVQNKKAVTIAYIDFSRAFDTVSHNELLLRLYSYGIRGLVLEWIKQFFRDRTHQTKVGDCLSSFAELLSGVVQGKAHKRANCILRCFASRDVSLLVRAFTVYVGYDQF